MIFITNPHDFSQYLWQGRAEAKSIVFIFFLMEVSIFFPVLIETFKGEKKVMIFSYVQSPYESFFSKGELDILFDPKSKCFWLPGPASSTQEIRIVILVTHDLSLRGCLFTGTNAFPCINRPLGGLLQGTHASVVSLNFSWPGAASFAMRGGWWPCRMAPLVLPPHIPPCPLPSIPPPGNRKGKADPPGRDLI